MALERFEDKQLSRSATNMCVLSLWPRIRTVRARVANYEGVPGGELKEISVHSFGMSQGEHVRQRVPARRALV